MVHKVSDFVVYTTPGGLEVFTWIKNVLENEQLYVLDFDDSLVRESELKYPDAPNFKVPDSKGSTKIDDYHRVTMIDRIVSSLQFSSIDRNTKVFKHANSLVFETVITNPKIIEDPDLYASFIARFNKIVATIQERIKERWNEKIPVELRFPVRVVELDPIEI